MRPGLLLLYVCLVGVVSVYAGSSLYDEPGARIHANTLYHSVVQSEFDLLLSKKDSAHGPMMIETYTASGIPLLCEMPEIATEGAETRQESESRPSPSVASILAPLKAKCMRHIDGWWTYEFCFGKQVRQYHANAQGKIEAEYVLGRLLDPNLGIDVLHSVETNDRELLQMLERVGVASADLPYYAETYEHGTTCDIASKVPRQIELRWSCSVGATVSTIRSVKEPASCQYIMEVDSPLLCQHPLYRSTETPLHLISCYFVDNEFPTMPVTSAPASTDEDDLDTTSSASDTESDTQPTPKNAPQNVGTSSTSPQSNQNPESTGEPSSTTSTSIDTTQTPSTSNAETTQQNAQKTAAQSRASKAEALGLKLSIVDEDEHVTNGQTTAVLIESVKQRALGKIDLASTKDDAPVGSDDMDDYEVLTGSELEAVLHTLSDSELLILLSTIDDAVKLTEELEEDDSYPHDASEKVIIAIDRLASDHISTNSDEAQNKDNTEEEERRK